MTAEPGNNSPEGGAAGEQAQQPERPLLAELKATQTWLEQAALAGGALVRLAGLELRLAAGDAGRLLVLGLAMLPLVLLAWIGLSVLLAWLAFIWLGSAALAIATFIAVQLVTLAIMAALARKFARSLSLPATRRQLNALKEQVNGTQDTGKADSHTG